MTRIIEVDMCFNCPFIGTTTDFQLRCLRVPSENYNKILKEKEIWSIPEWCDLPEREE